jgi:hypothetical protein
VIAKNEVVITKDGTERGKIRGEGRPCRQIEGCMGTSVPVRWPDGKLTWCCTKGMNKTNEGWRIG